MPVPKESVRLAEVNEGGSRGDFGAPISASSSGAQFAKMPAKTEMLGTTSVTISRVRVRIDGVRTASPAFPMTSKSYAFRSLCGTLRIQS